MIINTFKINVLLQDNITLQFLKNHVRYNHVSGKKSEYKGMISSYVLDLSVNQLRCFFPHHSIGYLRCIIKARQICRSVTARWKIQLFLVVVDSIMETFETMV